MRHTIGFTFSFRCGSSLSLDRKVNEMEYADLYQFPDGHPPSPYGTPPIVFGEDDQPLFASLQPGFQLLAIGWIERAQFTTGELDQRLIKAIRDICRQPVVSDGHLGVHSCAVCGRCHHGKVSAHGHYLLRKDRDVYMFPRFLVHYVVSHRYIPPERFCIALESGTLLGPADLVTRPTWWAMDETEGIRARGVQQNAADGLRGAEEVDSNGTP